MEIRELKLGIMEIEDLEALRDLNEFVCDCIRDSKGKRDKIAAIRFSIGDEVSFKGKGGIFLTGIIVKKNPKRALVSVTEPVPQTWYVHYHNMSKLP